MKPKVLHLLVLLCIISVSSMYSQTNYSLSFNGSSDYVRFDNSSLYTSTMTIEAWIKTTTASVNAEIVGWGNTSASTNHTVEFRLNNGKLEFGINTTGWASVISSGTANSGNWTHVAVVKNGSDIKLYINGVQDGSGTINQSPTVNVMEIGGFYYGQIQQSSYYFDGQIDEVRLWNSARSTTQIANNMSTEFVGSEGFTAYYKMNEGSGSTLNDNKSGGNYTGTIYNATYSTGALGLNAPTSVDASVYGSGSWIGYVYSSSNWPPNPAFQANQYLGSITQTEKFNQNWGGDGPVLRDKSYIDNFHVRYRMNKSFPSGKYNITCGGDDGYRLSVDGGSTLIINDWSDHGYRTQTASNVVLGENTNLVLEFFEIGGGAQVSFDYTQVCLSANIPISPSATVTGTTTATITWAANGNDGSVSYNWIVKNQSGTTISSGSTTNTSVSVTGLSAYTSYYFTVVASNTCGLSSTATSDNFTTLGVPILNATSQASAITATTAVSGGNITSNGGASVTARGVCWSTSQNPTIADSKTTDGTGTGSFTSNLSGLTAGQVYFVRAYATNSAGTAYGTQVSFTFTSGDISASSFANPAVSDIVVTNGTTFNCNASNNNFNSITVQPGGKLTLDDTRTLNAGSLVLESNATGTATFIDNNAGETPPEITATIKQYLTAGRNWYVATPLANATTAALSTAGSIVYYNEPTAEWLEPVSGSTLNPMRGYISSSTNATGAISFTGTLNSGAKSISLSRTTGQTKEGFNLVGNPYPSYVSWDDATKTNLESTIWYRTKNVSSAYVFDTYSSVSGIGTNNNGSGAVSGVIPPMQSFWVRVAAGKASGTLAFNNTMRSHGTSGNRLKAPSASNTKQKLVRLQVSNGTNSDEAILLFNPIASDSFDAYDSPKMSNGSASIPELYSKAGNETVAINGMKAFETEKNVALGFNTAQNTNFSIKATEISGFDSGYRIVLYDAILKTEHDLTSLSNYEFSSSAVNTLSRFEVRFKAPGITTGFDNSANATARFIRTDNTHIALHYNGQINSEDCVSIYNTAGMALTNVLIRSNVTEMQVNYPAGVYIVQARLADQTITQKIIIK